MFGDTELAEWVGLVRAEYLESPGLSLTRSQAQRLWGMSAERCDAVLQALVSDGFLRQAPNGRYVRAGGEQVTW